MAAHTLLLLQLRGWNLIHHPLNLGWPLCLPSSVECSGNDILEPPESKSWAALVSTRSLRILREPWGAEREVQLSCCSGGLPSPNPRSDGPFPPWCQPVLSQGLLPHNSLPNAVPSPPGWPTPATHPLSKWAGGSSSPGVPVLGPPHQSSAGLGIHQQTEPRAPVTSDRDTFQLSLCGHHDLHCLHTSLLWGRTRMPERLGTSSEPSLSGVAPLCSRCSGREVDTSCSGPAPSLVGATVHPTRKQVTVSE